MCGLAGFIDFTQESDDRILAAMTDALEHRGPDDHGAWIGSVGSAKIGLGHRRLSIIDLAPASAQPMSFNGLKVVYNGEIYNYQEIRENLVQIGHHFETGSDTEVLLHAFHEWGPACV